MARSASLPLWLACVTLAFATVGAHAQNGPVEATVKATYLYKFPPFIEWPAAVMAPLSSFTVCIVGNDPFGALLDQAVDGQRIRGLPIVVRRLAIFSDDAGCQVVYATGSPAQPVPAILAALRGKPILSVTDGTRDPLAKGIVNFVIVDNRVRFEINNSAALAVGLMISSKLLSLAVNVSP